MDRKECYRLTHPLSKISGYATDNLRIEIWHLFAGIRHSAQFTFEYFSLCMMFFSFVKKCSRPSWLFCHLLDVDRCCKHQTLFKCHKSQTECVEYSKTPGRWSETPPLLALRARAIYGPSSLASVGIHHLLLSNLTSVLALPRSLRASLIVYSSS